MFLRERSLKIFFFWIKTILSECAFSIKMMPSHHPLWKCAYWIASRCNFCTFYSQVHPLHNHQKSETYSQLIISLLAPSGKKYYCVQIFLKVWASQNYNYINYNLSQRKVQKTLFNKTPRKWFFFTNWEIRSLWPHLPQCMSGPNKVVFPLAEKSDTY